MKVVVVVVVIVINRKASNGVNGEAGRTRK
jgi:hypothetical protein